MNILMSDELLNGWIGINGEGGPLAPQSTASPHIPSTPQTQTPVILHKASPLIYTQSPACEDCCRRQSTSSDAANDEEEEEEDDSLQNDDALEEANDENDIRLRKATANKLNATSVSLVPNLLQQRASFQCLTELTAKDNNFDPYGTNVFKLNSVSSKKLCRVICKLLNFVFQLKNKPMTMNRSPNNILSNRKSPKVSEHSKSSTLNLTLDEPEKNARTRRLSQSFSLLKMINQPKEKLVGTPCESIKKCQNLNTSSPPHHAPFCPQSQCESATAHFRECAKHGRPLGRLLHYTNSSASDPCYQNQAQAPPAPIALQSSGCCGSGSTNGFAGLTGSATGGFHGHHTASAYQQKKHMRAYVVDEVSRWIFPLSFIALNIVYWAYYLNLMDSLPEFSPN